MRLTSRIKKISYFIEVEDDEYIVYADCPIGADSDDNAMMATMAEFICRANYTWRNGSFDLDMRDGEIRFKHYVDCKGIVPSIEIVKNSISYPAKMFNRYAPGIVGIIFSGLSAKEAITKSHEYELRSLLGEECSESDDISSMLEKLAAHLGEESDDSQSEMSSEEGNEV